MSIRLLIDMNLTPAWVDVFKKNGVESVHWSTIGDKRAQDSIIMQWAFENNYVVFTHDLDFGALLALTHKSGPSVIQVRTQNVTPQKLESILIAALRQYETFLKSGVLIVIEESTLRCRILPLQK